MIFHKFYKLSRCNYKGCQSLLSVKNFESTYILFKFLLTDYKFLLREPRLTLRSTELDRIDISCNTDKA